jgi:hypothetical protein
MDDSEHIEQLLNLNKQLSALQKKEIEDQLIFYINHLLVTDFNKLVMVLYRVDVSEWKLKELLQKNPGTDAAVIIAGLLIQRQEEKIKAREAFKSNNNIPEEDKW